MKGSEGVAATTPWKEYSATTESIWANQFHANYEAFIPFDVSVKKNQA